VEIASSITISLKDAPQDLHFDRLVDKLRLIFSILKKLALNRILGKRGNKDINVSTLCGIVVDICRGSNKSDSNNTAPTAH